MSNHSLKWQIRPLDCVIPTQRNSRADVKNSNVKNASHIRLISNVLFDDFWFSLYFEGNTPRATRQGQKVTTDVCDNIIIITCSVCKHSYTHLNSTHARRCQPSIGSTTTDSDDTHWASAWCRVHPLSIHLPSGGPDEIHQYKMKRPACTM